MIPFPALPALFADGVLCFFHSITLPHYIIESISLQIKITFYFSYTYISLLKLHSFYKIVVFYKFIYLFICFLTIDLFFIYLYNNYKYFY